MKKYILIAVPVILILVGIIASFNVIYVPDCENAEIICVDKTEKVVTKVVSKEDTETLKSIFTNNHTLSFDFFETKSCGFSGNYCIKLENEKFYPACDGCPIVSYKAKYINMSEDEIKTITSLMKKYGAEYPYM